MSGYNEIQKITEDDGRVLYVLLYDDYEVEVVVVERFGEYHIEANRYELPVRDETNKTVASGFDNLACVNNLAKEVAFNADFDFG